MHRSNRVQEITMTSSEFQASIIYQACHIALASPGLINNPGKQTRIGAIADLAQYADKASGANGLIRLSVEDFALLNGHWPKAPTV